VLDIQPAIAGQTLKGFTQSWAGHTDLFGEFALAGQVAVDGEFSGENGFVSGLTSLKCIIL
jgi:hypothetical protein